MFLSETGEPSAFFINKFLVWEYAMKSVEARGFQSPYDWYDFERYLIQVNRCILTPRWEMFVAEILMSAQKREGILKPDEIFYRARIGVKKEARREGSRFYPPIPYKGKDMGLPPRQQTEGGRMNPPGIPFLYLSTDDKTAIAEVRPWVRAKISLAAIKILRNKKVIDLTKDIPYLGAMWLAGGFFPQKAEDYEKYIWSAIHLSFATPVSPHEKDRSYIPTQYLAQLFNAHGYDGIKYKSSLHPEGFNICLFSSRGIHLENVCIHEIKRIVYGHEKLLLEGD